jgi:hypothetical protein
LTTSIFTLADIAMIPPKIKISKDGILADCRIFLADCAESFLKDSTQSAYHNLLKINF